MILEATLLDARHNNPPSLGDTMSIPALLSTSVSFDNTLGAMFIGAILSTLLQGVVVLQMFTYITAKRTRQDSVRLKLLVWVIFVLDMASQALTVAAIYAFVITNYANPMALTRGGGSVFTLAMSASGLAELTLTQLYFSWRIWAFSGTSLSRPVRISISVLTVILSLVSLGVSIDFITQGYVHKIFQPNPSAFRLSFGLSTSSKLMFDIFATFAMTVSLYNAKSGIKRSDHVITVLILFTVNTNLISTLLTIGEIVAYFVLPNATVYVGINFISIKAYVNTLLAALNAREYLGGELESTGPITLGISGRSTGAVRFASFLSRPSPENRDIAKTSEFATETKPGDALQAIGETSAGTV